MTRHWPYLLLTAMLLVAVTVYVSARNVTQTVWTKINTGLYYAEFASLEKSPIGDSKIRVLKIDPKLYTFHLANASAPGEGGLMSVRKWSKKQNYLAAINASLYQADHKTSISLMKNNAHVNNPSMNKQKTIMAFGARKNGVPGATIFDRECDDISALKSKYFAYVQSIRMISCKGKNVWKLQKETYSTAAIGVDKQGNILFIHVRSPYATHKLINNLLHLPLDIRTAMYVEGGPQAQMYVNSSDKEYILLGRFRSANAGKAISYFGWPIPNVIGIRKRK